MAKWLKRFWIWSAENKNSLQGIVLIFAIVTTVIVVPSAIIQFFRADLLVRVNIDKNAIPEDVILFNKKISKFFQWNFEKLREDMPSKLIDNIVDDPVLQRLGYPGLPEEVAYIELINQSESVISGVRVVFNRAHVLWGVGITGEYLSETEVNKFKAKLNDGLRTGSIVLPVLPDIQPGSSIKLLLYGDVDNIETKITSVGYSNSITTLIEVEDGMLIWIYRNPLVFLIAFIVPVFYIVLMIASPIWLKVRRNIIRNEKKYIFYDNACELAIKSKHDDAMILLRQAVEAGYSNRHHALNDKDLAPLRGRSDFQQLFNES